MGMMGLGIPTSGPGFPRSPLTGMMAPPPVRIGMSIDQMKGMFFREDRILRKLDAASARAFRIFGARVRLTAKHSMRKAPAGVASLPTSPPHRHARPWIYRHLYYALAADESHVIIGPALLMGKSVGLAPYGTHTVPQVQEFGGRVQPRANPRKKVWQIQFFYTDRDGSTSLRIVKPVRQTATHLLAYDKNATPPGIRSFALSRIQQPGSYTPYKQLAMGPMSPAHYTMRRYPPRPYMGPAFRRELPRAQDLWANSVK